MNREPHDMSDTDRWTRWQGEPCGAFSARVRSGLADMCRRVQPPSEDEAEAHAGCRMAAVKRNADQISITVEPDRIRMVYRTPATKAEPTE